MISRLGELGVKRVIDYAVPGIPGIFGYGNTVINSGWNWKDVKYQILFTKQLRNQVKPIGGMKNFQLKYLTWGIYFRSDRIHYDSLEKKYVVVNIYCRRMFLSVIG